MKSVFVATSRRLLCAFMLAAAAGSSYSAMASVKAEGVKSPIYETGSTPRLSWKIISDENGVVQKSYEIELAASEADLEAGNRLLWRSGTVESEQSILIDYAGTPLQPCNDYFWRVKVTTNRGETPWSTPVKLSTAFFDDSAWGSEWIGIDDLTNPGESGAVEHTRLAARYLRKDFRSGKSVKRAILSVCGLGNYVAEINGKRVGNDVHSPVVSWYPTMAYFNTYDVTPMITAGENAIGIILGNGRYFSPRPTFAQFGLPRANACLLIEYTDGSQAKIVTDETWRATANGPIIANNLYDGEEYVASKELSGWSKHGYDDSEWQKADIMENPTKALRPQPTPGLTVMDRIKAVSVRKVGNNRYIADMGQNMVGRLAVTLRGKAGKPVSLRFAETLSGDTALYLANLRSANVNDIYTPARDGEFSWAPEFTYHGFRFVEITGVDSAPLAENLTGEVIYDNMPVTGHFETSNELINRIYRNSFWGIRSNYYGMPTDCPQRDERLGWLGDRATGCYGENYIFGAGWLYAKWLRDIDMCQQADGNISAVSPNFWSLYEREVTWASAYFLGAQMLYERYGDPSAIKEHYASMKRWVSHVKRDCMADGVVVRDTWGDWCMPPESEELIHSNDPMRKTYPEILGSTVFYRILGLMQEFAVIAGEPGDVAAYSQMAEELKTAYNNRFFDKKNASYGNNTVTGNLLSLRQGLVPEGYEERVFDNIVKKTENDCNGHVSTGVVGIQHLMRGLTERGRQDIAYKIVTNKTYPSWGYMIENDATTIWELWNGNTADPAMNSANHVMLLGDLIIWFYENLGGIKNAEGSVAFKHIDMSPCFPDGLDSATAEYESPYGTIKSSWKRGANRLNWSITIPANTYATVRIPKSVLPKRPKVNGAKATDSGNAWEISLPSGRYEIR